MAKKENNRKNHASREMWMLAKKVARPKQRWSNGKPIHGGSNAQLEETQATQPQDEERH